MQYISDIINNYMHIIIISLTALVFILLIISITLIVKFKHLKNRFETIMGSNKRPRHNLELQLKKYYEDINQINGNYKKIINTVEDLDKNLSSCLQKVGIVRYNPFEEMGGNLCFAVAILDASNNGFVINGIHGRTGSYTYAKPVEFGVSQYILSDEEKEAIELAKKNAYKPIKNRGCFEKYIKSYKLKINPIEYIKRKRLAERKALEEEKRKLQALEGTNIKESLEIENNNINKEINGIDNKNLNSDLTNNTINKNLNNDLINNSINKNLNDDLINNTINKNLNSDLTNNTINKNLNNDLINNSINKNLNNDLINNTINKNLNNDLINNTINKNLNNDLINNSINKNLNNSLINNKSINKKNIKKLK